MARTFTKEEFQIALDRALAQKLAEEAGSEGDEEPSQQDDEDDEQIGVADSYPRRGSTAHLSKKSSNPLAQAAVVAAAPAAETINA